jgi:hypothetical protein
MFGRALLQGSDHANPACGRKPDTGAAPNPGTPPPSGFNLVPIV